jgi:NADPH2:quinone reductase
VITTVSTPDKADVVKRVGADDVILYTEKRIDEEVRRITGGKVRGAQRLGWMLLG